MKIDKFYNKKEDCYQYRSRFQLNNKEFRPVADTRKHLIDIIDEIKLQERRAKFGLETPEHSPTLQALFDKHLETIKIHKKFVVYRRIFNFFISLLPLDIKVTELKKSHFQQYIDARSGQISVNTKLPINPGTVNKELSAIGVALTNAPLYFQELDKYQRPVIPKMKNRKRRRERLVDKNNELERILAYLRDRSKGYSKKYTFHRERLADSLEFRYLSGFRRKEVVTLLQKNYFRDERALRNVIRWKTDSVTKFFPLPARAVEIIENRIKLQPDSEYLFTPDGQPVESDYRTLKLACKALGIIYGAHVKDGFVPHDLRHNFATEIIQVTDLETAKSLTGHTGESILTYLHTDEKRQREAMNKREKHDITSDIVSIYKNLKRGKVKLKSFVRQIKAFAA